MADLFEITLADGIPVAGDGDVKTINSLMEDGALATVGHLADAASTSTDSTPASVVSVLKQVSKVLQDLRVDWPASLGPGGGLKVESSNSPVTVTGTVSVTQTAGKTSSASFTSGTTAYAANDVVGGALAFAAVADGSIALEVMSVSLDIYRSTVISGETSYRLYLYSSSPPSAIADSSPMDVPSGDRTYFLGYVDLPNVEAIGSIVHTEVNNVGKILKTTGTTIYGYLVSKGPYTPTAVTYKVSMGVKQT